MLIRQFVYGLTPLVLAVTACAKRLINLGNVEKVVYRNSYRKADAINVLESVGIKVHQF